jgi:thiamine kinase-like enzyme
VKDDFQQIREISGLRRDWDTLRTQDYIRSLPIWSAGMTLRQKFGGLQNRTYFVTDGDGKRYVVRCGFDQYRTRQTSVVECTLAAARLGIGPQLRYAEPNLTVTDFVTGRQVQLEEIRDREHLRRAIATMQRMHRGSGALLQSISYWWAFDTVRRYYNIMEHGVAATDYQPSAWVHDLPLFRDVTDRLERAIGPFKPCFTHNDLHFVNMMYSSPASDRQLWFIDWDGGAYGHPMWDVAEMTMMTEVDEDVDRLCLEAYCGPVSSAEMSRLLHEHRAFKIMAALRLIAEVMITAQDPNFYLTAEEMGESMKISFPGEQAHLNGMVDFLRPTLEKLWNAYGHDYR